ncbi:DNA methyltransferase [Desulfobacterales bacterium HSG17]|nr:DNA methyltransferase [Desulfobacterales bacterium HSG17]
MAKKYKAQPLFEEKPENKQDVPVLCLGRQFENDDARREYYLDKLQEGLDDLYSKLQDVQFTSLDDAVESMKSVEKWPMGEDERIKALAEQMQESARYGNPEDRKKDLLQLWKDEVGFPHGKVEDILNLSDPPYYTACPNPFIGEFIKQYGKPYDPETDNYRREPFAADVSEGKNDPIYNAHSYHTKVPHKAIMRYILHYTEPGDIVFDGFCGTGMTGIAGALCGDVSLLQSMGYTSDKNNKIINKNELEISEHGERHTLMSDLSPLATFVSHNYSNLSNINTFITEALKIIERSEEELKWLYEDKSGGIVVKSIWSDVFLCPNCSNEIIFWNAAVVEGKIQKEFPCPYCNIRVGKSGSKSSGATKLERSFETKYDPVLKVVVKQPKFILVENTVNKGKTKEKNIVSHEENIQFKKKFEDKLWHQLPVDKFFNGRQTNKLINGSGIEYVCHMYTLRSIFVYSYLWSQTLSSYKNTNLFRFCLSSINNYISRKQGYFGGGGGVSGTLFTPSIHLERSVFDVLKRKIKKIGRLEIIEKRTSFISTQNITELYNIPDNSVDYIFTDPPFGESLQYAELNFFLESWLKIKTVTRNDCVLNYVHKKDLSFYYNMVLCAFAEYSRILKPNRWITIEFHNSQNAVWNVIQQAIESSSLIIADVRILDKQQHSFNAVNRAGAVNKDLVITAYKPNNGLENRFQINAGKESGVWDFIKIHLRQLPVFVSKANQAEVIAERQNYLLYDRMVAFHVQRGIIVPLSAAEFYAGLSQRFPERDGMYFLPEQIAEYDKKRIKVSEIMQLSLFVTDEASAILWLKQQLEKKPQTFQEIHPQFIKAIGGWSKAENPIELSTLLEQSFLRYDETGPIPTQIVSWMKKSADLRKTIQNEIAAGNARQENTGLITQHLSLITSAKDRWYVPDPNKAGDLEKLREKSLFKEFREYLESKQKRLKKFRLEAVRAGFKKAWQEKQYQTIIDVAQKIPDKILQEDQKLLMWYDQALIRTDIG